MAGTLRPNRSLLKSDRESGYIIHRYALYDSAENLFNGSMTEVAKAPYAGSATRRTMSYTYWYTASNYLDIEVLTDTIIWDAGSNSHNNTLSIFKNDGGTQGDFVTKLISYSGTYDSTTPNWSKIAEIPKGRYIIKRDTGDGTRISHEWYLEDISPSSKILLLSNQKVYSHSYETIADKSTIIQIPSVNEQNLIKYGVDSPFSNFDKICNGKNYILSPSQGNLGGIFEQVISRKPLTISSTNKLAIFHNSAYYTSIDGITLLPLDNSTEIETLGFNSLTLSKDIYNLIGENPKVVAYSNNESDILIETTTNPFDIYDEFGKEVEVLYYTEDKTIVDANLVLETNWSPLDELEGNFDVVTWTDKNEEDTPLQLTITAAPHPQLIMPTKDIKIGAIEKFESIELNSVVSGRGVLNVIFSFDEGNTWYTWNGSQFTVIQPNLEQVLANGITPHGLKTLPMNEFNDLRSFYDTFRMAYALEIQSTSDQAATDELAFKIEMKGTWKAAVHGRDYDYEYPNNSSVVISLYQSGDFKMNV